MRVRTIREVETDNKSIYHSVSDKIRRNGERTCNTETAKNFEIVNIKTINKR